MNLHHPRQNSYPRNPRQNFIDPRNPRDPRKFSTHVTHAPTPPTSPRNPRNLADSPYKTDLSGANVRQIE